VSPAGETTTRESPARERLLTAARLVRGPAVLVVIYAILRAAFVRLTEREGLVSPSGSVSVGIAVVGLLVLVLRLVVLFVLPALVAYRLARRVGRGEPRP
jgi:hypothetical protein